MAERSSRCSATPIRRSSFVTHEDGQARALLRDLQHRAVLRRQGGQSISRATSAMSGCIAPPATSSGVDPTEVPPRIALADDTPADRRALCLHRGAEHDAEQVLEQPQWLARDRRLSEGGGLPRRLHRPEAGARHRPRLEPHSARRRGRDRRPAAVWSARAGCAMPISSSACRAGCRGSPGRSARRW